MTRFYWERHIHMIEEGRRAIEHKRGYSEAEYLYDNLKAYLKEHQELDAKIEKPLIDMPQ